MTAVDQRETFVSRLEDKTSHAVYFAQVDLERDSADFERSRLNVICTDGTHCWQVTGEAAVTHAPVAERLEICS